MTGLVRRGFRVVLRHLSYANVVATAALFIALGGASYAVTQINGSHIKKRSIAGIKLKRHTVTPDELRDLVVSSRHGTRRSTATAAASTPAPASITQLSVGQSATVLQSGPFSYIADCNAGSSGQPLVTIQAMSTESGALVQGARDSTGQHILSGGPYQMTAGQPVIVSGPPSSDQWDYLINGARMIAPSGASLLVELNYGTQLYGAQCWASGFGVS